MNNKILEGEPIEVKGAIIMPFTYFPGATLSKFFTELRDKKKILAIKCPQCGKVYMPPRSTCAPCFAQMEEWVEVGPQGRLITFSEVKYSLQVHPTRNPLVYGIIKLDGADTGFTHLISDAGSVEISSGMRVEAVFNEKQQGNILDIAYFRPI